MEFFLERIARSLKDEYGNTLNRHCLVFPGRRAGLYLLKHLAAGIDKPIWAPPVSTINDLFRSYSRLQLAGNEILLPELYKIYKRIRKTNESFDDFYSWGDMLINDFEDVDKYLVNASDLFKNLSDLKKIDQEFGSLTEAQIDIIRQFWLNFDAGKPTVQKTGFLNIWSVLYPLYEEFRNTLRKKNLAYEGMIFREIAESDEAEFISSTEWEMVHFIGFNALNECEKRLMLRLKKAGKAKFYWDYDNSYINGGTYNSAGHFMRENLRLFGNDMPSDWSYNTMLSADSSVVKRQVIETSSDIAQVKLVSRLVSDIPGLTSENAHQTAIVLADENLLIPLLTSLPQSGEINITMGYPLKQSLIYTLLKHILELQTGYIVKGGKIRFNAATVKNILVNTLISEMLDENEMAVAKSIISSPNSHVPQEIFSGCNTLSVVFRHAPDPAALSSCLKDLLSIIALSTSDGNEENAKDITRRNILNEFIYRIVLSLNRLEPVVKDEEIRFTNETFARLLDRMLRTQSVPFSGEPLSGIQIMGILETRVLDFRNLVILSVNEGVLPAISSSSSFIPFNLRSAFGLPSVNHQESIFAYHFYRLLQKAENVIFTYNSNSEGLRNGEMSRFLIQMKYDPILKPEFHNLDFTIKSNSPVSEMVERNETHISRLKELYLDETGRPLSPSAINTWLGCRMKFYYRYVNGLKEPETVSSEIDPAMFGTLLHEIMKLVYSEHMGKLITASVFDDLLKNEAQLREIINSTITDTLGSDSDGIVKGNELIIRDVLLSFIKRILRNDRSLAPFKLLHLEQQFSFNLILPSGKKVKTGGIADRIDVVSGITRIVDYKTGNVSESVCNLSDLFQDDRKKEHDGWLQALIYCEAYLSGNKTPVRPSLYGIKRMSGKNWDDHLKLRPDKTDIIIDDYNSIRGEFMDGLQEVIEKIFSNDEHFTMTSDARGKCTYCAYNKLCLR
jgi:CRISPR/Cas system-associated exonuclease Cas4 (RecB family)